MRHGVMSFGSEAIGPNQERHRDPADLAARNRRDHAAVAQGAGDAADLQPVFAVVDASRGIDREHDLQIDRLGRTCGARACDRGQTCNANACNANARNANARRANARREPVSRSHHRPGSPYRGRRRSAAVAAALRLKALPGARHHPTSHTGRRTCGSTTRRLLSLRAPIRSISSPDSAKSKMSIILLDLVLFERARNDADIVLLDQPPQRHLRGRLAVPARDLADHRIVQKLAARQRHMAGHEQPVAPARLDHFVLANISVILDLVGHQRLGTQRHRLNPSAPR